MLYNLLSAFKRVALPPELHAARPKRLRFVLLNGIGRVVRHARETVLRLVGAARRQLAAAARLRSPSRPARRRSSWPERVLRRGAARRSAVGRPGIASAAVRHSLILCDLAFPPTRSRPQRLAHSVRARPQSPNPRAVTLSGDLGLS